MFSVQCIHIQNKMNTIHAYIQHLSEYVTTITKTAIQQQQQMIVITKIFTYSLPPSAHKYGRAKRRNIVSARVQWFSSSWLNGDKWSLVYIFCQFVIFQRQMVTKSNIFHIGNCRIHAVQQSRSNDQPQVYRRTLSGSLCCNALQKMHSRRT